MHIEITRKVVIWANDNYNALGILRQLVPYGVNVYFIVNNRTKFCATKSKYCHNYRIAKTIGEGLQMLLSDFKEEKEKPILITASDLLAEQIDLHRDELLSFFVLMGTRQSGLLTYVLDKNIMCSMANDCGLNIPKSVKCKWNTDISNVTYPCIIKPNKHVLGQKSYFKTKILYHANELKELLAHVNHENEFTLQEYIPKEKDILIIGCRMFDGTYAVPGAYIKDRWYKGGDGSHGLLTANIPQSVNINAIKNFLERIDYYGAFSAEFGLYNNKAYFYEINLRNDGTSNHFNQAGANLNLAWVLACCGLDYKKICNHISNEVWFIDEIADLQNVRDGIISKREWKKERKQAQAFMYWDARDPMPFRYMVIKSYLMPLLDIYRILKGFRQ